MCGKTLWQSPVLSHPGSCRRGMLFHSHHSTTIWQRPPTCSAWTRGRQLYPKPAPVIHSCIAEGLCRQHKSEKRQHEKEESICLRSSKWEGGAQSPARYFDHPLRNPMEQKCLRRPTRLMVAMSSRRPSLSRPACAWTPHGFHQWVIPFPFGELPEIGQRLTSNRLYGLNAWFFLEVISWSLFHK